MSKQRISKLRTGMGQLPAFSLDGTPRLPRHQYGVRLESANTRQNWTQNQNKITHFHLPANSKTSLRDKVTLPQTA